MKLATFNINGVRARLPNLLDWLAREQPDAVALQELKCSDDAFPAQALRDAGYHAAWSGQTAWNGVAVLARGEMPVEIRRGLPGDPRDLQSRYLEARVGDVLIACLYLPNGNPQPGPKFDYKLAWFDRLLAHAAALARLRTPVALVGDFNVVPTDFDIYNTRSWLKDALLQPESRERYARLLEQGWLDSIRALFGERRVYTFWDYFRNHWQTDSGLRIDHLLLNAPLAERLTEGGVDTWVRGEAHASDHAPTWVQLAEPAQPPTRATGRAKTVKKAASAAKKAKMRPARSRG